MSWREEVEEMTTTEIKINLARGYKGSEFKTLLSELSKRKYLEETKPKPYIMFGKNKMCYLRENRLSVKLGYRQSKVILNNINKIRDFVKVCEEE